MWMVLRGLKEMWAFLENQALLASRGPPDRRDCLAPRDLSVPPETRAVLEIRAFQACQGLRVLRATQATRALQGRKELRAQQGRPAHPAILDPEV